MTGSLSSPTDWFAWNNLLACTFPWGSLWKRFPKLFWTFFKHPNLINPRVDLHFEFIREQIVVWWMGSIDVSAWFSSLVNSGFRWESRVQECGNAQGIRFCVLNFKNHSRWLWLFHSIRVSIHHQVDREQISLTAVCVCPESNRTKLFAQWFVGAGNHPPTRKQTGQIWKTIYYNLVRACRTRALAQQHSTAISKQTFRRRLATNRVRVSCSIWLG